MPSTVETDLADFVGDLPGGVNVRSLVHAWMSGGGDAQVGKITARLLGTKPTSFTAATVHTPRGDTGHPSLELSRILLEQHGVDWVHWSDEFADLAHHGFDPAARFPRVVLDDRITPAEMARLVVGLRDLAVQVA